MNRPMGWVYFRPFGAVSCTDKSDMAAQTGCHRNKGREKKLKGSREKGIKKGSYDSSSRS
jgi:hypothetical protein